jgi:hypothetical protein
MTNRTGFENILCVSYPYNEEKSSGSDLLNVVCGAGNFYKTLSACGQHEI